MPSEVTSASPADNAHEDNAHEDDSQVELPQRSLPQVSLRLLLAIMTGTAVLFVVLRLAVDGYGWAQVVTLLLAMAITTLLSYALAFTIGIGFYERFGAGRDKPNGHGRDVAGEATGKTKSGNTKPDNTKSGIHAVKQVVLVMAWLLASQSFPQRSAADNINYFTHSMWPKPLEYVVFVGSDPATGVGGYYNLHLKVVPTGNAYSREHHLTFSISTHNDSQRILGAVTTSKLVLPQSGGEIHHDVLIPNFDSEQVFRIRVMEDGRSVLDERRGYRQSWDIYRFNRDAVATICVMDPKSLGLSTAVPDLRSIAVLMGGNGYSYAPLPEDVNVVRLSDSEARSQTNDGHSDSLRVRLLEPLSGAASWLALSELNVIVLPQEFWSAPSVSAHSRDELRRWVAAGGILWSYGDASQRSHTDDSFAKSLAYQPIAASSVLERQAMMDGLSLDQDQESAVNPNGMVLRQDIMDALDAVNHPIVQFETAQAIANRVQIASYGLGRVVTIDDPDPFPGSLQFWRAVQTASMLPEAFIAPGAKAGPGDAAIWDQRFGIFYEGGNDNYWRWLINEVGGPPVKSFLVLNTLFVLLVGPVACLVLARRGKLYLLYFFAPTMACLVSGSLFAFAIVSDGLGTKVRAHQWTWIDSANDVTVHQDRSTYYSALGSGELLFPADALVGVCLPTPNSNNYVDSSLDANPGGRFEWTDKHQIWSGDFLPPRSQIQYLVTRPLVDTASALEFEETPAGVVRVTNRFPDAVGPLVYRSQSGNYYRIERIDSGATEPMQASNQQAMLQLVDDQVLPPQGFVPDLQYYGAYRYGFNSSGTVPELERRLGQWRIQMPEGSFCGLRAVATDRIAIENAELFSSLQIVMGQTQ